MALNREKIAAGLALLIFVLGFQDIVRGYMTRVRDVRLPEEVDFPLSARKIVPRKFRMYSEEGESGRNPFSFSEGWQRSERSALALPPLPAAPIPLPLLSHGPSGAEGGFVYQDAPPAEVKATEAGEE